VGRALAGAPGRRGRVGRGAALPGACFLLPQHALRAHACRGLLPPAPARTRRFTTRRARCCGSARSWRRRRATSTTCWRRRPPSAAASSSSGACLTACRWAARRGIRGAGARWRPGLRRSPVGARVGALLSLIPPPRPPQPPALPTCLPTRPPVCLPPTAVPLPPGQAAQRRRALPRGQRPPQRDPTEKVKGGARGGRGGGSRGARGRSRRAHVREAPSARRHALRFLNPPPAVRSPTVPPPGHPRALSRRRRLHPLYAAVHLQEKINE
jgi:hypothetical protein